MTEEQQSAAVEEQKSIDQMTVKELRELAKESDISGTSAMKKDELLARLKKLKELQVKNLKLQHQKHLLKQQQKKLLQVTKHH